MHEAASDPFAVAMAVEQQAVVFRARQSHGIGAVRFLIIEVRSGNADIEAHVRAEDLVLDGIDLAGKLARLVIAPARDVVVVDDPHPVDFCSEVRRPPAEEHHAVGAPGHGRHGHAAHLAGLGSQRRKVWLRAEAGLLLGHDEIAGRTPRYIEMMGLRVSVAPWPLHLVIKEGVVVEPQKVEIAGEASAEVQVLRSPHVVEDEPIGVGGTQDFHLIELEPRRGERQEAMVVEDVAGAGDAGSMIEGQNDLVEIVICGCPEITTPNVIKLFDRAVPCLQEPLKLDPGCGRIGARFPSC